MEAQSAMIAKPKLFYGWWIVAASLIILFITLGLASYSFGVFFKSLTDEFSWNRATISAALSIFLLAWGLACPLIGRLTDRYGVRRLMISGAIALGTSFCLLSLTNALWHLYLLYACAGVASATCSEIPVSTALSNWFKKKRGIAMGIASTGMGFGGLFLAPLIGKLILSFGWRATFLVMGLLTWVVSLPVVALMMRTRPQEIGLLPDGERTPDEAEVSESLSQRASTATDKNSNLNHRATAISTGTKELLLTGFAFSLVSLGIMSIITHEVPFIIDMGISLTTAATALGLTAGMGILGKLSWGYLADRFSPKWVLLACIALQAVGMVILMYTRSLGMVWVFVIVFGFAKGGVNPLRPLIIGEFFGIDSFGRHFGITEAMRRLGAAAGPFMAGYIFDITGSYHYAFITIIVAYLVSMVIIYTIHPAKQH